MNIAREISRHVEATCFSLWVGDELEMLSCDAGSATVPADAHRRLAEQAVADRGGATGLAGRDGPRGHPARGEGPHQRRTGPRLRRGRRGRARESHLHELPDHHPGGHGRTLHAQPGVRRRPRDPPSGEEQPADHREPAQPAVAPARRRRCPRAPREQHPPHHEHRGRARGAVRAAHRPGRRAGADPHHHRLRRAGHERSGAAARRHGRGHGRYHVGVAAGDQPGRGGQRAHRQRVEARVALPARGSRRRVAGADAHRLRADRARRRARPAAGVRTGARPGSGTATDQQHREERVRRVVLGRAGEAARGRRPPGLPPRPGPWPRPHDAAHSRGAVHETTTHPHRRRRVDHPHGPARDADRARPRGRRRGRHGRGGAGSSSSSSIPSWSSWT